MTPSKRSSNPIEPSNKAGSELGRRAAGAAAFLLGGVGAAQLIRLVGNVVLTRLLFPEAFGLMGQVVVFLIGLHLFSDIGIGPSIVQSARGDDPKYLNTAWTIQIGRGTVLWLAGLAVAYPFAAFYEKPNLAPLLLAASTTSLITGFQSTKINLAARNLNQRSLAKLDLTSQAAGLVVTVSCAYAYRSVWALVAGSLFADVVRVTLSHIVLPGPRNHFRYDSESARSLIRFGRWIFLSTVLTFLVSYSDRLIFPKLVDSARFGIYQTGANIAALAPAVLSVLANHILFPVYSRILQSGGNLRGVFSDVRRPLLIAGGWALSGLAAGGPAAVHLLYDARYHSAGWVVQLLAVGAWFALLEQTNSNALLAQGRSNLMAATNLAKLVGISICVPLGYRTLGFPGAVMGYAASDSFKYAFSAVAARKLGLSGVRQDAFLTGWFVGAALLGNAALRAVASVTDIGAVHAITVLAVITILWLPRARGLKQPQIGMPSGDEQEAAGQATDVPPVAASGAGTDR